MRIRPEAPEEFPRIRDLVTVAFETARVSDGGEGAFVDRLRAGGGYMPELALVAEEDGRLIGQVMATKTWIAKRDRAFETLLVAPLSVVLDRRGRGVGAALMRECLGRARGLGHGSAMLVGDPAYYGRFGFVPSVRFDIVSATAMPEAYVLACELVPGALRGIAGVLAV